MIYLDHNATTPVDGKVLEAMLPFFSEQYGNAHSHTHQSGRAAARAATAAREQVALLLGCETGELIFTSGATEAANLAIKGASAIHGEERKEIITWTTEHPAVLEPLQQLQSKGYSITRLPVDREGMPDVSQLQKSISDKTLMVCAMLANNETGVVFPVAKIAGIAHAAGALFCTDATQAAGKMRIDVHEIGADLLFVSAHKFYGPKGIGALFVRKKSPRVQLEPLITGGGQENGLRAGTLNVPGIVGMGAAAQLVNDHLWDYTQHFSVLRTTFEQMVCDLGEVYINGAVKDRIPNTTNLLIQKIRAKDLLIPLQELCFSFGSACSSAKQSPSHVLKAMGLTDEEAYASVRISVGRKNTMEEVVTAANMMRDAISDLRKKG